MKGNNKGLSLLEVTVILVLMAIIGVVVVPNMQMIQKQKASKVASEICTDLMTQRTKAYVTSNTSYALKLTQSAITGNYYSYVLTPAALETTMSTRKESTESMKNINIEIRVTNSALGLNTTTDNLTFKGRDVLADAGAGPTTVSGIMITVTSDKSAAILDFNPLTGHYEINVK